MAPCLPLPGQALSDGEWHTVAISVGGFQVSLLVDDEPPSTMQLKDIAQPGRSVLIGGRVLVHLNKQTKPLVLQLKALTNNLCAIQLCGL